MFNNKYKNKLSNKYERNYLIIRRGSFCTRINFPGLKLQWLTVKETVRAWQLNLAVHMRKKPSETFIHNYSFFATLRFPSHLYPYYGVVKRLVKLEPSQLFANQNVHAFSIKNVQCTCMCQRGFYIASVSLCSPSLNSMIVFTNHLTSLLSDHLSSFLRT